VCIDARDRRLETNRLLSSARSLPYLGTHMPTLSPKILLYLAALILLSGHFVNSEPNTDQVNGLSSTGVKEPQIQLESSYGEFEDKAAKSLVTLLHGEEAARSFSALSRNQKAEFLDREWRKESPLFFKYYYGYHVGQRLFSVSPAFYERGNLIPRRYFSDFAAPHPDDIEVAEKWVEALLSENPEDPVALCALGYLKLESDQIEEACELFSRAIRKRKKLVEARNGRALSYLKMHRKKALALEHFRETISLNRRYVGALYGMAMCHIAMMGQDRVGLDDYFGKVVEADPDHQDAHYKLGAFNEALRRHERAAEAYSRQLAVNPAHGRAAERLAQVSMVLKGTAKPHLSHLDLVKLSEKDPTIFLPLLADSHIERREFTQAAEIYTRYIPGLPAAEAHYYRDLSLIASGEIRREIEAAYPRSERERLIRKFWVLADPTPTTKVNERRIEHYRRTYHARSNFSEGIDRLNALGWDRRGDLYIRFGKPDHQSWSDYLVFETDPDVAAVKNRINHLAYEGLTEVLPPRTRTTVLTRAAPFLRSHQTSGVSRPFLCPGGPQRQATGWKQATSGKAGSTALWGAASKSRSLTRSVKDSMNSPERPLDRQIISFGRACPHRP
jgi:GWxTD domain-containing protein